MKQIGKIIAFSIFWVVVIGVMVLLGRHSSMRAEVQTLTGVDVVVKDSSRRQMVDPTTVRRWIAPIKVEGVRAIDAPLSQIEQAILAHGYVRSAEAYLTPDGRVVVEVEQHDPVMRMMLDGGYDFYLTTRGEVFRSPELSAAYVPVVTGRFDVPFTAKHEGATDEQLKLKINELDSLIDATNEARSDLLIEHRHIQRQRSKLRSRTVKKGMFESKDEFEWRKESLKKLKKDSGALYTYRMRVRQKAADQKSVEVDRLIEKQKKLQKNYEDFINLTNFVKLIEGDDFWRAQIVEIVVSQSQNGALFLRLVPRAGNHTIIFGRIEKVERKLDRLLRFYREGLDKEGWDIYRTIDVRFDDQVVCTKR